MKRRRRVVGIAAALLGAALVLALLGLWLLHRAPAWYNAAALSDDRREQSFSDAAHKYNTVLDMAAQAYARDLRVKYAEAHGRPAPTGESVEPVVVSFTEDEINAQIQQWLWGRQEQHWANNPIIALSDGEIILAARLRDSQLVVSVYLEPKIDAQGLLELRVASIRGGALPIPQVLLSKPRRELAADLEARLAGWQTQARFSENGMANGAGATAAMAKILLSALDGRASSPVLFMADPTESHQPLPVRLTDIAIDAGKLTLTVRPVRAAERQELMRQVQEPYDSGGAGGR
jgi:hypothetical protein